MLTLRDPWEGVFGMLLYIDYLGWLIESISMFYFDSLVLLLLLGILTTSFTELYLAVVDGRFLNVLHSVIDGLLILRFLSPISSELRPNVL